MLFLAPCTFALASMGAQDPLPGIPELQLVALPPIDLLAGAGPPPPIRDVNDFCLLDEHRLAVLRDHEVVVVVTDRGDVVHEYALPVARTRFGPLQLQLGDYDLLARTGPDRLVVAPNMNLSDCAREPSAFVELDLRTGQFRIPAFLPLDCDRLEIAGGPDGELAVLTAPYGKSPRLQLFDAGGSLEWSRERRLCQASVMRFTPSGSIALLDQNQNAVQVIGWRGWWSTYTRLRFPGDGIEPFDFFCDAHGNWEFLCSARPGAELVHTNDRLVAERRLPARHAEGTPIDVSVRLSPSGRIWASDWYSISRIGLDGYPEVTLGARPEDHRLTGASRVAVDRDDHIFAIDQRDDAVHEFDPSGKRVRITPRPAGTPKSPSRDPVPAGFESQFSWWMTARCGERTWKSAPSELELLDAGGATLFRTPLGGFDWCAGPSPAGTMAILQGDGGRSPSSAVLVDLQAREIGRWKIPELQDWLESSDFDGRTLLIATPDRVVAWRSDGSAWFQASIPYSCSHMGCGMMPSQCWVVHLACEGRELWLRRGPEATTIERYALP